MGCFTRFGIDLTAALRSRAAAFLVLGALSTAPLAAAARASDAARPGPFAVGFTSFVELDGRDLGIVFRRHVNGSARPVPMMVFYPVDPADAAGAPTAAYPRNPFLGPAPAFLSTSFEQHGVDPAYQQATPTGAGPFPLAVLSQGAMAPYWFNVGLATRLAGHGFVVALLAHYGEAAYASPAPSDPRALGSNPSLQRALNRNYDFQLAIDRILARSETPGDLLHGLVDPARIAAGGHSIGGLSTLQVVGGDEDLCDTFAPARSLPPCVDGVVVPAPLDERRVGALVLLDPSVQLLHWTDLHRVTVPAIVIGQDYDSIEANSDLPGWIGGWAHQAMSGDPTYLASVVHSAHLPSHTSACAAALVRGDTTQYHDIRCDDPTLTPYQAANELVWRYAVAFLKTVLVGDHRYQPMLTPGWAVANEPFATFYVNERKNGQEPPAPFGDASFVHTTQPNPDLDEHPVWLEW